MTFVISVLLFSQMKSYKILLFSKLITWYIKSSEGKQQKKTSWDLANQRRIIGFKNSEVKKEN